MSYTFCTSQAIVWKAGANLNSSIITSNAVIQKFSDDAEGYVNVATRYDWTANSGAIGTNLRPMIAKTVSALAAISLLNYDMESVGRNEAQARINVLFNEYKEGIQLLKNIKRPELEY